MGAPRDDEQTAAEAEIDPVEMAGHLRMSVARLARLLRQQDESGLSATLTAALATIAREGPITLGELAARERVAPPSITKVVAKLEERGLVERTVDEQDRRVNRLSVSRAGRRQLEALRTRRTAWLVTRLTELAPDDLERLAAAVPVLDQLAELDPRPDATLVADVSVVAPTDDAAPADVVARRP
jgi:DNA-binding MarR family transcriptional regulator